MSITTNQPDTKSNPNRNPTTKPHAAVSFRNKYSCMSHVTRELHTRQCYFIAPF